VVEKHHRRPQEADQGNDRRQPRCSRGLNPAKYTDERFGLPTVQDILKELEKPGRDPRPEFKTATFADGVEKVGTCARA
jgi:transcriptional accessory protein Tex/SPT6